MDQSTGPGAVATAPNADVVLALLRKHLKDHRLTLADAGRRSGISADVLGRALKWLSDDPALHAEGERYATPGNLQRIAAWLAVESDRDDAGQPNAPYVDTICSRVVVQAAARARRLRAIGMVTGPSGVGKTRGADAVRAQLGPRVVHYVIARSRCSGAALVHDLATMLGKRTDGHATRFEAENWCATRLNPNDLVIIDQAHQLLWDAHEELLWLWERARCAILLLGTEDEIVRVLHSEKWNAKQLRTRLAFHMRILPRKLEDGKGYYSSAEVAAVAATLAPELRADTLAWLRDEANRNKGLREVMDHVLPMALEQAKGDAAQVTPDLLAEVRLVRPPEPGTGEGR